MTLPTLDLLAAVVTHLAAHLGGFDGLAVDAAGAGSVLAASGLADADPQGIDDLLPGTVLFPGGDLGDQIVWQVVPLTAGTGLVEQRVDHLPQVDGAGPAAVLGRWQQG